jgi:LEM domain
LRSKDDNISHSNDHISNEELVKQLAKYNIPCPGITQSTRPILIKNLAVAKSRSESKVFSPHPPQASLSSDYNDEEECSETDSPDDGSDCSLTFSSFRGISPTFRTPTTSKPKLQFSKQHSLTMGHCTPLDSKSKLNTSDASNIFILSPSVVFNRFVEEQEPSPYDTGSDSEADEKKD